MKKHIKRIVLTAVMVLSLSALNAAPAALPTGILEIIRQGIVKVIKAVDLKIQRLQNQTIWLQNAQKVMENTLSKVKLDEIADWTERQREQYQTYYEELHRVKGIIFYYQRIKEITQKQIRIVEEYKRAWELLKRDKNFTTAELQFMEKVYDGILRASIENVEQVSLIVRSFSLQMSDAKRLELINETADKVDENYDDLRRFNQQNILMSLQRSKEKGNIEVVKQLYGLK